MCDVAVAIAVQIPDFSPEVGYLAWAWQQSDFSDFMIRLSRLTGVGEGSHDRDMERMQPQKRATESNPMPDKYCVKGSRCSAEKPVNLAKKEKNNDNLSTAPSSSIKLKINADRRFISNWTSAIEKCKPSSNFLLGLVRIHPDENNKRSKWSAGEIISHWAIVLRDLGCKEQRNRGMFLDIFHYLNAYCSSYSAQIKINSERQFIRNRNSVIENWCRVGTAVSAYPTSFVADLNLITKSDAMGGN